MGTALGSHAGNAPVYNLPTGAKDKILSVIAGLEVN